MLAKAVTPPRKELKQNKEDEEALASLFGEATGFFTSGSAEPEDEVIEIELWDVHKDVFDLYRLLYPFNSEMYKLDTGVMLALIQDYGLDRRKAILDIQHIHYGFIEVLRGSYGDGDS